MFFVHGGYALLGHEVRLWRDDARLTGSLWAVTLTGILEIAGAIGLLTPRTQKASAVCLIVLPVALFPANAYAALNDLPFRGQPPRRLWVRALIQLFFAWVIWWTAVRGRAGSRLRRSPARLSDRKSRVPFSDLHSACAFIESDLLLHWRSSGFATCSFGPVNPAVSSGQSLPISMLGPLSTAPGPSGRRERPFREQLHPGFPQSPDRPTGGPTSLPIETRIDEDSLGGSDSPNESDQTSYLAASSHGCTVPISR